MIVKSDHERWIVNKIINFMAVHFSREINKIGDYMADQGKFMEELEAVKNIAVSQNNSLTKEEIQKYLSDMNLSDEQFEQVYYYLSLSGINIEGYRFIPKAVDLKSDTESKKNEKEMSETNNVIQDTEPDKNKIDTCTKSLAKKRAEYNSKMYMDEIEKLDYYEDKDEKKIISEFLNGNSDARNKFIENRLTQVINIANKYSDREVVKKEVIGIDELIAEGNVGLLEAVSVIEQNRKNFVDAAGKPVFESIDGTIYMEVTNAIESLLDTMTSDSDWETAVLARTNLLNEAAKYMTEEMGRVPTKEELSEYTKISVDEIRGIMGLSKDTQRIADTTAVRFRK